MQRIARCAPYLILVLLAGCESPQPQKPPPGPPHQAAPAQPNRQSYVRRPPPLPPVQPLPPLSPPRKEVVQPQPAPAPRAEPGPGTLVSASQIRPSVPLQRGRWQVIVVHHSADEDATPSSMDRYHRQTKGWKHGLGYHFVIGNGVEFPDGQIYVGSRWKQQIEGAHCATKAGRYLGVNRPAKFFNERGIGICLIGNMQSQNPTRRQLAALDQLIELLCDQNGISANEIYGHGEVTHRTACPGRLMNMAGIRKSVAAGLRAAGNPTFVSVDCGEALPEFDERALAWLLHGPKAEYLAEPDGPDEPAYLCAMPECALPMMEEMMQVEPARDARAPSTALQRRVLLPPTQATAARPGPQRNQGAPRIQFNPGRRGGVSPRPGPPMPILKTSRGPRQAPPANCSGPG